MHVPLRKIPVKRQISVEGDTSYFCNNNTAAQPRIPIFKLSDCRNTLQKHCGTSKMLQVRYCYTPSLPRRLVVVGETYTCKCRLQALFPCDKPVKQRIKHHVQDGRRMNSLQQLPNKERWSLMMTSRSSIGRYSHHFSSIGRNRFICICANRALIRSLGHRTITIPLARKSGPLVIILRAPIFTRSAKALTDDSHVTARAFIVTRANTANYLSVAMAHR